MLFQIQKNFTHNLKNKKGKKETEKPTNKDTDSHFKQFIPQIDLKINSNKIKVRSDELSVGRGKMNEKKPITP